MIIICKQSSSLVELNHQQTIFNNLGISEFRFCDNYIKWFAPSIDYPCIPQPYYLFFPLTVEIDKFIHPTFREEMGESGQLLDLVKDRIVAQLLSNLDVGISTISK